MGNRVGAGRPLAQAAQASTGGSPVLSVAEATLALLQRAGHHRAIICRHHRAVGPPAQHGARLEHQHGAVCVQQVAGSRQTGNAAAHHDHVIVCGAQGCTWRGCLVSLVSPSL